jgi:hypothetical protein
MANTINKEMFFKWNGKFVDCKDVDYMPFSKATSVITTFAGNTPIINTFHDHSAAQVGMIKITIAMTETKRLFVLSNWYANGNFPTGNVECPGYKGSAHIQGPIADSFKIGAEVTFTFICLTPDNQ